MITLRPLWNSLIQDGAQIGKSRKMPSTRPAHRAHAPRVSLSRLAVSKAILQIVLCGGLIRRSAVRLAKSHPKFSCQLESALLAYGTMIGHRQVGQRVARRHAP